MHLHNFLTIFHTRNDYFSLFFFFRKIFHICSVNLVWLSLKLAHSGAQEKDYGQHG